MSANAYAYRESPEERQRVAAALEKMGVTYPAKPRAEVVDLNTGQPRRQPLGLRPVDDPANSEDDDPANGFKGFHFRNDAHGARPEDALRSDWTFRYFDILGAVMISLNNDVVKEVNQLWEDVKRKIKETEATQRAEQRLEVAELKTIIAELRAEVSSLRAIQENQRTQSRGEQGVAGPRGVPGDRGPVGPAGPQGPQGDAAAMIVGWEPDPQRFMLTPVHGNGSRGVGAGLMPFFEAYDASVRDDDEA
jgi:hypothetical protein